MNRIYIGDALATLARLESASVDCCVTSPPYYGLRDYQSAQQIGQEETIAEYVARLASVFDEVARVLKPDGTLWLNLGDSYANDSKWGGASGNKHARGLHGQSGVGRGKRATGLPDKSLMGMPWRVAFALQDRGWILRAEIIWNKGSAMPESVRDRPTRAHETVFLFSRQRRYYYDADAIAEPCANAKRPQYQRALQIAREQGLADAHIQAVRAVGLSGSGKNAQMQSGAGKNTPEVIALAAEALEKLGKGYYREFLGRQSGNKSRKYDDGQNIPNDHLGRSFEYQENDMGTRNARDVWDIPTQKSGVANHFAVMPCELARRCIVAGCPEDGVTLDPFFGAGTTGLVAARHNRRCVGIELNPDYAQAALRRLCEDNPLFSQWQISSS